MKSIYVSLLFCFGAGSGAMAQEVVYDSNAEVRTVSNFSGIDVSGAVAVYLSQANENVVVISAGDEKYNSKIKTEVKNGVLHISVDGGMWNGFSWADRKLKAYISVADIKSIAVSGASYISVSGILKSDALALDLSGASEIKADINVKTLNLDASGASVVRLSGTAGNMSADVSGAGKLTAYELVVDHCKASASGASTLRVMVNKQLNASASGGSNIFYKGEVTQTNLSSSGGATIKKRSSSEN